MERNGLGEDDESYVVLLYYKYASIPDVVALSRFYNTHCQSLNLLGRIRVSPDGVNATLCGKLSSLEKHIVVMKSNSLFSDTDFKLASSSYPSNEKIATECGFTSLAVRIVKELVTFRSDPLLKSPEISNAGRHLSAAEFHHFLQEAGNVLQTNENEELVLLDARNLYETRIGKFKTPNVNTLDPEIRQYSDLAVWIDKNSDMLRNKKVMMYCTGGIRCEMASAYIRSKGAGFENVFQLYGGIQRYLEQFPDGGYFKGKNFVFDHRISVESQDKDVLGACLLCCSPFDDYSCRCRCAYCRILVLVCYSCQGKGSDRYVCELCQKHGKGENSILLLQNNQTDQKLTPWKESEPLHDNEVPYYELSRRYVNGHQSKLRILCLHGFRQNASGFKGRTSSLSKKLKKIVEFIFVDAPHELPFICQPEKSCSDQSSEPSPDECKKRFAWLISLNSASADEFTWKIAKKPFDPLQYQDQTDGFEESYSYLQDLILRMGPFDGILGFSQGAAMAALFCQELQRRGLMSSLRFAILCSGFYAASDCSREVIKWPSLHVFGGGKGRDRQINTEASRELSEIFDKNCSVIIEHDMGHIIPTRSPFIDQIKAFLMGFL